MRPAVDASASASAAVAAFEKVASSGEVLLNDLNNAKNRSESSKRNREVNEGENALDAGKRTKTTVEKKNGKGQAAKAGSGKNGK